MAWSKAADKQNGTGAVGESSHFDVCVRERVHIQKWGTFQVLGGFPLSRVSLHILSVNTEMFSGVNHIAQYHYFKCFLHSASIVSAHCHLVVLLRETRVRIWTGASAQLAQYMHSMSRTQIWILLLHKICPRWFNLIIMFCLICSLI